MITVVASNTCMLGIINMLNKYTIVEQFANEILVPLLRCYSFNQTNGKFNKMAKPWKCHFLFVSRNP